MRVDEPRSWVLPYGGGKLEHSEGADRRSWDDREREASTLWQIIRALNDEPAIFEALKVPFRREMKAAVERFTTRFVEKPRPVQVSRLIRAVNPAKSIFDAVNAPFGAKGRGPDRTVQGALRQYRSAAAAQPHGARQRRLRPAPAHRPGLRLS